MPCSKISALPLSEGRPANLDAVHGMHDTEHVRLHIPIEPTSWPIQLAELYLVGVELYSSVPTCICLFPSSVVAILLSV